MTKRVLCTITLIAAYSTGCVGDGVTQRRVNEDNAVGSYRWIMDTPSGVRFQLVQRVPDQARSFYVARGFTLEAIEGYASCVMQTIVNNNTTDKVVALDLANWRVVYDGLERPLKLTADWQKEWTRRGLPKSARIAFQWSQFPNIQKHEPGDWFQGMISTELPPASLFDLKINWTENGVGRTATIKDVQCAEDRNLDTE